MTQAQNPHRRYNPLLDEWVLVSPHRSQRPWLGQVERTSGISVPEYEPNCYLCPGNERAGGEVNPAYRDTFAFQNDFPALLPVDSEQGSNAGLMRANQVTGECRVLCFSPRHDQTLATMPTHQVERVIAMWQAQTEELGQRYAWVQIFENHGEAMGASNPHPHGQVWATDYLPSIPAREDARQRQHFESAGSPLLMDYLAQELETGERVVLETDHWAWLVPYWATWPFEVLLLPKVHVRSFGDLTGELAADLARILKAGLAGYDALFGVDFPYSMGWHGPPQPEQHWQLHAHFYPPLLRSASVRKFMVGFEMLAESQRDITPEQAAARLREVTPKV